MVSPTRSTRAAGRPFSVWVTVSTVSKWILSVHRAAAWAVCCELTICAVSCWTTCCSDCPEGNSSVSGTTAVCGVSHARTAVNTLNPLPGPPRKETVTRFRCPEAGYVRCPATSRVTVRRDMGRRLRTVDPFALAVAEYLVLPDRDALLELVDQGTARGE